MRCKMIEQNESWISIDEAAKYMDVKTRTVRSWIKKKTVIFLHIRLESSGNLKCQN